MFRILSGNDISKEIQRNSTQTNVRAYIASAYCRSYAFNQHVSNISNSVSDKKIVVRWQARDLVSGASDLELYKEVKSFGWTLYINQDLHAKAYLFDDVGIIGSANLTTRGLEGFPPKGNHEISILTSEIKPLEQWFDELIDNSVAIDDEIFYSILSDIEESAQEPAQTILNNKSFSPQTMNLLAKHQFSIVYTHDLFWTNSPSELIDTGGVYNNNPDIKHDLHLLNLPVGFTDFDLQNKFKRSAAYNWLEKTVRQEMYFGELTAALHSALSDDPAPYRKEVKKLTANLLSWFDNLANDEFVVDRPGYSQRIARLTKHP